MDLKRLTEFAWGKEKRAFQARKTLLAEVTGQFPGEVEALQQTLQQHFYHATPKIFFR